MGSREFRDQHGRRWLVWEVRPTMRERRSAAPDSRPSPGIERRRRAGQRTLVAREYADGWLTCETAGEKRRIAPIPDGWETLPDEELSRLCGEAREARPSRRLVE